MRISEMITKLENIVDESGDMDCVYNTPDGYKFIDQYKRVLVAFYCLDGDLFELDYLSLCEEDGIAIKKVCMLH